LSKSTEKSRLLRVAAPSMDHSAMSAQSASVSSIDFDQRPRIASISRMRCLPSSSGQQVIATSDGNASSGSLADSASFTDVPPRGCESPDVAHHGGAACTSVAATIVATTERPRTTFLIGARYTGREVQITPRVRAVRAA
jgi:hypothetical protein